jgi:adenylate cyclase
MTARPASAAATERRPSAVRRGGWVANAVISLLVAGLGWCFVHWKEITLPRIDDEIVDWQDWGMDWLQRQSFDLPYVLRQFLPGGLTPARPATDDIVLIYMDEESTKRLGQPPDGSWNRALHARLLERLTRDGARAVFFDVVFDTEKEEDAVFAAAMVAHGGVFIGATVTTNQAKPLTPDEAIRFQQVGLNSEGQIKSNARLRGAARGSGLLIFRPIDDDYGVRRLYPGKQRDEGLGDWPALSWQAATHLGAKLPGRTDGQFDRRWVNYYGSAGQLQSVSYHRVLAADGGAEVGYFKDKIVVVGGLSELDPAVNKVRDKFSTPFSWSWLPDKFGGRGDTPGAEIHATILLNLLQRDWLERVPVAVERWLVVVFGLALGALRWLRPWRAVAAGLAVMVAVAFGSALLQWHGQLWWNWAVPVIVQVPAALGLAISSRYYLEERQRRKLRQAFGLYLSPELATEIADRDFVLQPGGEKVEATLLFTDLEGFTTLSEKLGDSARLGRVLQDYFTRTTDEILAQQGTVIKFIGDAVYAAWGAPLPQPDHPVRAVRAAWRLAQAARLEVPVENPDGTTTVIPVRTRLGVHTGEALAGNLGSARRFDYTLIGDAVNFAARLEGANKYTGTSILLSEDTVRRLDGQFLVRRLGAFRVKGRGQATGVYELLGEDPARREGWLDTFEAALRAWEAGDLPAARTGFAAVGVARGGSDGPSEFFLRQLEHAVVGPDWDGTVTFGEK